MKPETPLEKFVFWTLLIVALVMGGIMLFRPSASLVGAPMLLGVAVVVATSWLAKRRKAGSR